MEWRRYATDKRIVLGALGCIALYLAAFIHVPLFYDEVAARIYAGRGFIDGFTVQNLQPQCRTVVATQPLFVPVQAFFSWWDGAFGWAGLRMLPLLALAVLLATLLWGRRPGPLPVLMLSGAFIGITGVSFVLSRPEYVLLLHAAAIIATWRVAQRGAVSMAAVMGLLLLNATVLCFSLYVHMQGLLLVPLSFIACLQLLARQRLLAMLMALFMAVACWQALAQSTFHCPEDPVLEQAVGQTQGTGYGRGESANPLVKWAERGWRFQRSLLFKKHPEQFSQPLPSTRHARFINPLIVAVALGNLALLALAMVAVARSLWRESWPLARARAWPQAAATLLTGGRFLWLTAALLLAFYSLYDVGGSFYRAHLRHFLTVLLLVLVCLHMPPAMQRRLWLRWGMACFATCALSAIAAWVWIAPALARGDVATGVVLPPDQAKNDAAIRAFAARCGITDDAPRVIVDDATYRALRSHRQPIGYLYIWYGQMLKPEGLMADTPEAFNEYITRAGASGYVVRCSMLDQFMQTPQLREGDYCCRWYAPINGAKSTSSRNGQKSPDQ